MDRQTCARLDAEDPIAHVRGRFGLPDGVVYLDGNSLGALPLGVRERVDALITSEWGDRLIRGWNESGWLEVGARAGAAIAALLGAKADEVLVTDTTTVNLFKALHAALELVPDRAVILREEGDFPTDAYVAEAVAAQRGATVRTVARDDLAGALTDEVAVLMLTHVDYRTGAKHDLAARTSAAHAVGAVTLWDLSHSAGAVRLDLSEDGADLAVGCGYKYLNGGPGAPSYLYVARRHQAVVGTPIPGWFGHADTFAFGPTYTPAPGIRRFQAGTTGVIATTVLEAALGVWSDVDLDAAWAKAQRLTEVFIDLVDERCGGLGVEVVSPRDATTRGAQINLRHPQAGPVMRALISREVIGDVRPPNRMRFGFPPLYTRFVDVWDAVEILRDLLTTEAHTDPEFQHDPAVP